MALFSRITLIATFVICTSCLAHTESENLSDLDTNLEEIESKQQVSAQSNKDSERQIYAKVIALEESLRSLNGKIQHLENTNKKLTDRLNKFIAESNYKSSISPNTAKPSVVSEAVSLMDSNKPEGAVKILSEYVNANPQSELDEVYYLLGKAYTAQNLHQKAGAFFLKCYKTYPNKPRASESLLNVAKSLRQLNNYEKACSILDRLDKEYTNRSEAEKILSIAEKKLNKCAPYDAPTSSTLGH